MLEVSKEACLVSMKFKSQLWEIISKYPPRLLNRSSRTAVGKDQRACWPIKTGFREKQVLQDPGYVGGVKGPCCMVSCKVVQILCRRCQNKIIINEYLRLHLRLLIVMSEVSKALYTQMNRMKPQILQWLPYYLIRSRSHCNSNFNSK